MTTHLKAYTRQEANKYLPGDINPSDFDFNLILTREQKLKLFERNEIMQLMCEWPVIEALRQRITFEEDEDVDYKKFGKVDFLFTATPEEMDANTGAVTDEQQAYSKYLEWTGFWNKLQEGMSWSQLFGQSAAFFWGKDKGVADKTWERSDKTEAKEPLIMGGGLFYAASAAGTDYSDFDFYYPITDGVGYKIIDKDEKGKPTLFKVTIFHHNRNFSETDEKQKVFYMDAERVILFDAPRRRIQFGGSSMTKGIELYALAEEIMIKNLSRRAALLAGGIATFTGIEGDVEAKALDAELGPDITSLDRMFLQQGVEFDYVTPDLKLSSEFFSLFDILSRIESRFLRLSQKLMDGESQGVQGSAKFDMLSSYTRIYGLQQHYNRPIEEMFYRLGKTNTSFTWNDIIPEMLDEEPIDVETMPGGDEKVEQETATGEEE